MSGIITLTKNKCTKNIYTFVVFWKLIYFIFNELFRDFWKSFVQFEVLMVSVFFIPYTLALRIFITKWCNFVTAVVYKIIDLLFLRNKHIMKVIWTRDAKSCRNSEIKFITGMTTEASSIAGLQLSILC